MVEWLALATSKGTGCNSRLQGDGWPCMCPKFVGCESKSPRDGWEMAGWLALAISKDFGVSLKRQDMAGEWLGGWPWLCPRIAGGVCVCKDLSLIHI